MVDLPGIGDYVEPEYDDEELVGGIPASWYYFNEDRSDGWDETDDFF